MVTTFSAGKSRLWPTASSLAAGRGAGAQRRGVCVGAGGLGGILPREVLRVEGAIGLPDGEDEVEKLAHAVAHRDVAAFALGPEAAIEGADGGVVADGGPSGVPEVGAHQIVAFCATCACVPAGKGLPCLSTPELFSSGKMPK